MSAEHAGRQKPVENISGEQREASQRFLEVLQEHLRGLCKDLPAHTITDVRTTDKVRAAPLIHQPPLAPPLPRSATAHQRPKRCSQRQRTLT